MDVEDYICDSLLKIRVNPNSNKTEVKVYDEVRNVLVVNIASPAENNKANMDVIRFFSKLTKKKVRIKNGLKSRNKTLLIID
ncbi:YggU family protein [Candidatus Woesearchaeota archaeon]|jgi:hypothetical protein|nr:YggU family protein [Candidatus Woesearchaeota archaeon]|tara:strand:- start:173 stop:418 length:246 start_codon:yes stop_codon:yes gene_type:complete